MLSMTIFLFLTLAYVGLVHIIVDSKILNDFREKLQEKNTTIYGINIADMTSCHQCCGFWAGLISSPLALAIFALSIPNFDLIKLAVVMATLPVTSILFGCYVSLVSMLVRAILDWLTLSINIPFGDSDEQ